MADMVDLACSLALSPSEHDVSSHIGGFTSVCLGIASGIQGPSFGLLVTLSLGCIKSDLSMLTPLKQTCTCVCI